MTFKNKKLLIFDLDGTLINSALDLAIAVNHMLKELGLHTFEEKTIHGWVGNGALTLVSRALSGSTTVDNTLDTKYVEEALEIFLAYYANNLCNATVAYDTVPMTLQTLKSQGLHLAIVTNKPFDFVEPILKGLHLDNLFTLILGGDSLEKKKPDPMPLMHVCSTLGISIDQSLMIGDSKNDILAANACNMHSVGVTYGYNYGEAIDIYSPSLVIEHFSDLLKAL